MDTNQEKVLAIYPYAFVEYDSVLDSYFVISNVKAHPKFPDLAEFIGEPAINVKRAWYRAWKNIQRDMLMILEDDIDWNERV